MNRLFASTLRVRQGLVRRNVLGVRKFTSTTAKLQQEEFEDNNSNIDNNNNDNQEFRESRPRYDFAKRVFVANLAEGISEEAITQQFANCGTILNIKLPRFHDTGKPRGFAFVDFETLEGCEAALGMHGAQVDGKDLVVRQYEVRERKPREEGSFYSDRGSSRGGMRGGFRGSRGGRGGFRGGRGGYSRNGGEENPFDKD